MKILFLPEFYYPHMSGVPVVVKYLAEGLCQKGHDVAIATQQEEGTKANEIINDVKVYRFAMYKDWKHCYRGDISGFVKFVENCGADAVIFECTQCITTDVMISHIKDLKGRKYFHIHGISGLSPQNKLFKLKSDIKHTIGNTVNWISSRYYFGCKLNKAMPQFNATMCLSEIDDGIDYIQKYSRKNYILDNAADNMFFDEQFCQQQTLKKYAKLENSRFVMSCANYSYIKNQKEIIRQYYFSEASKDTSLVCIGSRKNEYYDECLQVVQEMEGQIGHRDVHLLYGVERTDIPGIINQATVYLVGSFLEQYSISVIEAMSQGVPFVSTNVGNARLLPGGVTVGSISDMHIEIDKLLQDKILYNKLSTSGYDYAYNNCRIEVAVNKLEEIIKS